MVKNGCGQSGHVFMHNSCSSNEIAGFLMQLFLENKSMKQPHILNVDTNSQKLKVDQKICGWA